jgi:hypothetical protein
MTCLADIGGIAATLSNHLRNQSVSLTEKGTENALSGLA